MRRTGWIIGLFCLALVMAGCATNIYKPGWDYYREGEVDKAVQYFQGLENQSNYNLLCKIYSDTWQHEKAVKNCEKALRMWRPVKPSGYSDIDKLNEDGLFFVGKAEWAVRLTKAYEETGQLGRAIDVMKQWVTADHPNDANGFVILSSLYLKNRQFDEAITAAKRSIELKPDNSDAYYDLAVAYSHKKQVDEALNAYQKSLKIRPGASYTIFIYTHIGDLFFEMEDYSKAVDYYKKASEKASGLNGVRSLFSLAKTYRLMGKYDDALASVNKVVELKTFTGIGIEFSVEDGYPAIKGVMGTGPAKKAGIETGDKIIKIDGKSTKGWNQEQVGQSIKGASGNQVTLTLERKGIDKPLEKLITRETIIGKNVAFDFGLRSLIHRYRGNQVEALKDAEKAYSLDSANGWAHLAISAAYLDQGQYDESIKLLSRVKGSSLARILEATAYVKQGDFNKAVEVYSAIPEEEMSPKNIPLMNDRMVLLQTFKPIVKEHRDKARLFESKGQYKEALSELSEALKTADDTELQDIQETIFSMIRRNPLLSEMPEDARKYALRSEVLVKEGNFEKAAAELKKAIQIAPYVARLYYNCALINAELKKYPEAIRHMKIYLKAAPDAPDARAAKDEIFKWEFMMEKGK